MTVGPETARASKPIVANSVLRPIRTIVIRTMLCGGLWLAQWLAFPYRPVYRD